jgi:hypothetical protein
MAALDFPNAPTTGQVFLGPGGIQWMWDGTKWIVVGPGPAYATTTYVQTAVAPALNNVGRNKLHNGLFRIAQRGTAFTASGYTLDRWLLLLGAAGDTATVSQVTLSDAARALIGDEEAQNALQIVFTGGAAAANFVNVPQRIENVGRLSGKTIIVSFWANAAVAGVQVGVGANQNFGTGGSPSPVVPVPATPVTLSTTWTRQSVTLTLPSDAGKTLGTNGDSFTSLNLWLSSGSTNAANAGVGVQSGTVNIWGAQVEIAQPGQTLPSPVEKLDPRYDLDNCQRYYFAGQTSIGGYGTAGVGMYGPVAFPTRMRAPPTMITTATGSLVNCSAPVYSPYGGTSGAQIGTTVTAAGGYLAIVSYSASADL